MTKQIKLAAIVTLYNPMIEDINNIYNYLDGVDKLYVIDNTEKNNNKKIIPKSSKIKYIFNNENVGVATALNIGAQNAIKDGYNYLLTMDQDSVMTIEILEKMKKYIINNDMTKVGLISPNHDVGFEMEKYDSDVTDVIEIMTSGNIINLDIYQKVNGFKDELFIDCVDTEYCMNLHKNGYSVIRLNNVIMKHNLGERTFHKLFGKTFDCSNHSAIRRYYMIRNNHYIYQMYKDYYYDYCKKLLRIQRGQIKRIILFEKHKFKKIKMALRGYRDYKKNIKGKINS